MSPNNPYQPPADHTRKVVFLPAGTDSLARFVPTGVPPGTLCVLSQHGGIQVQPDANYTVRFGRNAPDVDVAIGANDDAISRMHGTISHDGRKWRLYNDGRLPIRLPGSELLLTGQDEPLPRAYTPLFIKTDAGAEHLLEVRVTRQHTSPPSGVPKYDDLTRAPRFWGLNDIEKLTLVALGQRYLRHEPNPQPQSWAQVVDELAELQPDAGWTTGVVQFRVLAVRKRLAVSGIAGLTAKDVPPPIGNTLNHNLLMALLSSSTLVPPDLDLLDPPANS